MNKLMIIEQREVLGKDFKIYGDKYNPLFLAKDVADWIDYDTKNTYRLLTQVESEEKVMKSIHTLGGSQEAWFLTEDGLYEVLMQSRKPIAKMFKKEVKGILKQIRLTGGYIPVQKEESPAEIMAKALMIAQKTLDEKEQLLRIKDKNLIAQKEIIQEYKPKVDYYNEMLSAKGLLTVNQIAKDFGMSAISLNKLLADLKIQYKQNGQWLLYAKYAGEGFAQCVPAKTVIHSDNSIEVKVLTKWTMKGRAFIYSLLSKYEIHPIISSKMQQMAF